MNTPKVRILIFGHKEFSQLVSSVLNEYAELAQCKIIDAIIGTIDEANAHINVFAPDIVISAGSNAAYLQASLKVPVLSMPVTESDIISAISSASKVGKDIHVITYDDYTRLVSLLNKTSDIKITHSMYKTAVEAKQTFDLAQIRSDQIVVGASLVCGLATKQGIKSFLIYSRESCRVMMDRAVDLGKKQKSLLQNKAIQRWLFNDSKTPILVVDNNTDLIATNAAAKKEFALSSNNPQEIVDILHNNQFSGLVDGKCRLNNNDWFFHKDNVDMPNHRFEVYQFYAQNPNLAQPKTISHQRHKLVYESAKMRELVERTDLYAQSPSHVLIIGESGTGKEMIARRIHHKSQFSTGQFIAINCAAMPSELFEGELFGYVEGAFTGSKRGGKHGLLYEAEGGVLFLDEIGELSLPLQAKLLRVIQEKSYRPVGSHKEFNINLKIIAATNRPLLTQVESGLFRNDLYYRLNVLSLQVPSLSARKQDLAIITQAKLSDLNYSDLEPTLLDEIQCQAMPIFNTYNWPGNIRELENIVERLLVYVSAHFSNADSIELPAKNTLNISTLLSHVAPELFELPRNSELGALVENEIQLVNRAMSKFDGNKEQVAQFLGISQTTLWRRLKRINEINH